MDTVMLKSLENIKKELVKLPEVLWDRYTGDIDNMFDVYGWIKRNDGRSDFVLIEFETGEAQWIMTSSAKYSEEFSARLGFNVSLHEDCKRVEDDFDIDNVTKIGGSEHLNKKAEFHHTAVNNDAHLFIDGNHDPDLCPECIRPGTLLFNIREEN